MRRRDVLGCGLSAMAIAGLAVTDARAQAKYPERPIKLVVPFVAGGINDTVARLWADRVRTRSAASSSRTRAAPAARSAGRPSPMPSPTAIRSCSAAPASQVLNPLGMSSPLYDPIKDFEPIAVLAFSELTLAVHPSLPVHTLKELDRLRQGESGQADLRLRRYRHHDPSRRRTVQVARGHPRHRPRPLQGVRRLAHRRHQRTAADGRRQHHRAGARTRPRPANCACSS